MGLFGRRSRGMLVGAAIGSSRAKKRAAMQQPGAAPAPTAANADVVEQLKQFAELKSQGILTQAEFDAKKKQLLGL